MRIADSADWRNGIPFETPVLADTVVPGDPARCVACGPDADPLERTSLWAYKHRHPKNHSGFVRFYCRAHTPAPPRAPAAPETGRRSGTRGTGSRATSPLRESVRRSVPDEAPRAVCPDCFVEATAAGVCSMCGNPVA